MPTNEVVFNNGANGEKGYRSSFSHDNEIATPGYYSVHLDDTNIDVSLTVSDRSGIHNYTFPSESDQVVIIDLVHRDMVLDSKLDVIDKSHISCYRFSSSWAQDQRLFYDIEFSRPYADVIIENNSPSGKSVKAAFIFDSSESNELEIRVGISAVDQAGALQNRKHELDGKTFEDVLQIAENTWEKPVSYTHLTLQTNREL